MEEEIHTQEFCSASKEEDCFIGEIGSEDLNVITAMCEAESEFLDTKDDAELSEVLDNTMEMLSTEHQEVPDKLLLQVLIDFENGTFFI